MDLFGKNGIMTKIFTDSDIKWSAHKNHDKSKHAFMLNRMMAIQFPVQAQYMNVNGVNPLSTVETWRTIAKQLKRSPGWMYTKMNKADKITVKKLKYKPTDAAIEFYINKNEHYRANSPVETREDRFISWLLKKYPAHKVAKSNPILQRLRSIKHIDEIDQIRKACQITKKGFNRVLKFIKPDVWEYQIEAEFIHEFINNSSKGFAYSPIIASGQDNNVLHYVKNNKQCKDGELILMDVGAEYGNYSSDMTRTIPVSGHFSKRQKEIYNTVLRVKNEATKLLTVGNNWKNFHDQVGEIMTKELLDINLLDKADIKNQTKKNPAYKKYFMHGTSHHLGLDTHDYGLLEDLFQENMVFTVEPGIYIPEEGFGVRLEDDVVIQTKGEPINLMEDIPIETDHIEELMN